MNENRLSAIGQIEVYIGKCFRLFRNEKQWKYFISSLVIILLIALVTGPDMFREYGPTQKGAFAIVSACIWSGLFNSIRSVCQERAIIKREHRTGLRISSYILAHVVYEMFLCAVEALIVLVVVCISNSSHMPPEGVIIQSSFAVIPEMYISLFLVTFSADMLALLVSCIVKDENTAMMIMPLVLVVQLVMGGVIFELSGIAEYISRFTISRWGVNSLCTIARTEMVVDLQASWYNAGEGGSGVLVGDWLTLLAFCILYIVIAIVVLGFVDKDER